MVNKKGQEMSVATLVLIVIGIVVLVMLILGFSMGWQNLWGKINIFGGGSNVETVVQACKLAAQSDSTFSYCNEFKKVTINGQTQYINCQAEQITGLDKTLDCGRSRDESAKAYCASIYGVKLGADGEIAQNGVSGTNAANLKKDTTLYNGKTCLYLLTGKQGADAISAVDAKTAK